jgi:hypothetical protein
MSFVETSDSLALKKSEVVQRFGQLIAPKSDPELEAMAQTSRALKLQKFWAHHVPVRIAISF